jgi:CheY-like chemotaxis protein
MHKNKVLFIVDDDEDDINLFVEAVNEIDKGMGCYKAKNGEDALARLDALDMLPDVIFLDLNMPRMNGRETLERLKASERYKNIPVVIYSTSNAQQDKDDTKALGAADYLTKPDSFTDLCIALARTIRTQAEKARE